MRNKKWRRPAKYMACPTRSWICLCGLYQFQGRMNVLVRDNFYPLLIYPNNNDGAQLWGTQPTNNEHIIAIVYLLAQCSKEYASHLCKQDANRENFPKPFFLFFFACHACIPSWRLALEDSCTFRSFVPFSLRRSSRFHNARAVHAHCGVLTKVRTFGSLKLIVLNS